MYHQSVKVVQRSKGRSSTAAAAYRSGERIADERTGLVHDFTRRSGVDHKMLFGWEGERADLWNRAEAAERRKDATTAREYEVALPAELTRPQMIELVSTYCWWLRERHGVAIDVGMHDLDSHNPHAHILTTTRPVHDGDFSTVKAEVEWSDKKRKQHGLPPRKTELEAAREMWGEFANRQLELAGSKTRIDHRSLAEQGIDRPAQIHLGSAAAAMERKGVQTERGDLNRLIPEIEAGQKRQAQMQQDLALEREVAPLRAAAEAERQRQVTEQAQQARKAARAAQRQRQAEGLVKEALEAAGGLSGAHEQAKALRESISRLERQGRPQEPPKPLLTPTPDVIPSGHSVATDKARERIPLPVAKGKTLTLAEIHHRAGVASERSFRAFEAADKARSRLAQLEVKPRPDWWRFKARAAHRHQIDQARADLDAKQGQHQQAQQAFERWSRMEQKAEQWLDSNPKVQQHLRGIIEAENAEKLARYEAKMQDHRKAYAEAEPYRAAAKALTPKAEQVEAVALERQMAQERERLAREREEAERRMREATGNESMLDRAKRGDFKQERKGPRRDLGPSL